MNIYSHIHAYIWIKRSKLREKANTSGLSKLLFSTEVSTEREALKFNKSIVCFWHKAYRSLTTLAAKGSSKRQLVAAFYLHTWKKMFRNDFSLRNKLSKLQTWIYGTRTKERLNSTLEATNNWNNSRAWILSSKHDLVARMQKSHFEQYGLS